MEGLSSANGPGFEVEPTPEGRAEEAPTPMVFADPHNTPTHRIVGYIESRCRHWEDYSDTYHALVDNESLPRLIPPEITEHNLTCPACRDEIQQAFGRECMSHYAKPDHVKTLEGLRL